MRPIYILITLTALFIGASHSARAAPNPNPWSQLPLVLIDSQGRAGPQITLGELKGNKPLYLKFWASWCKACMKEMPALQEHYEKYGESIQFLSVNLGIDDDLDSLTATLNKFGLELPATIDTSGALARSVNFVGMPYHVVFDKDFNWVHKGHAADATLEKTLMALSQEQHAALVALQVPTAKPHKLPRWFNPQQDQLLFFTTPWCEWYLADTRPHIASRCSKGQQNLIRLKREFKQLNIVGVVTPLWTSAGDMAQYQQKYQLNYPLHQDKSQLLFERYQVKDFATLVVLQKGAVSLLTTEVESYSALLQQLNNLNFLESPAL